MMVEALKDKGYNSYAVAIPFANEVLQIFKLAASVFIMMLSKVAFYSLLVYFATSMDTQTVAAYQVLMQIYCMFAVWESLYRKSHNRLCQNFYMVLNEVCQRQEGC
ncbi:hypothetical protein HanRHA438_Chr05g0239541 [Helianthus annuus]|nr:putative multi antimicrobial extrusion protein DinF [Helianthus annuus]KAJ0920279.1 hypothetical protein HanRHA438_Chr05g0239541 [Helianthus annuus]